MFYAQSTSGVISGRGGRGKEEGVAERVREEGGGEGGGREGGGEEGGGEG